MKKPNSYFVGVLLFCLWISVPGQSGKTSDLLDSEQTAKLIQIVEGVRSIPNPLISATYSAEIADLIWPVDEAFARELFRSAIDKLYSVEKADEKEIDTSFRNILSLLSKHDKKWACTLLESRSDDSSWKAHTSLKIAEDSLSSDPARAADFAQQSLQFDLDPAFVSFLKRLRPQNPTLADNLFIQAISRNSGRLSVNSFAFLGTYLFTSPQVGVNDFQTVSVTLVGNIFVPNISVNRANIPTNLVQFYLQHAILMLNMPADNPEERALRYAFGTLLMPKAQQFAPGLIAPLAAALARLGLTVPRELTSADAYKNIFKKPSASSARLEDIEKVADSYTRDRLLLDLVFQAYQKKDFATADAAIAKIEDEKVRGELETLIRFREGVSLMNGSETDRIRSIQIASKMQSSTEKCLLWLGIALASKKAKQEGMVDQSLGEALDSARLLQNEYAPYLLSYIATQKADKNPLLSKLVFAEAIRSFNKFEELPGISSVHNVTLDPITLPFSIAVGGVTLTFQNSAEKIVNGNFEEGIGIIREVNNGSLKGMVFVLLAKSIIENKKQSVSLTPQETVVVVTEDGIRKTGVKTVMPIYPKESLKSRARGAAVSEIQYDGLGNVTDVKILQSPDTATGRAIVYALRQWKFTPSKLDGKPVSVRGKITFYFVLDSKGNGKVENPKQFNR